MWPMERHRTFTFGRECGTAFRLQVRDNDGRRNLSLTQGGRSIHGLSPQALELMQYLLDRTGKDCFRDDILDAISPSSDHNLVDKYISDLREKLSPDKADLEKYIETVAGGYRFRLEVETHGDLGSMDGFSEWNKLRFHELMGELKRGPEEGEDLRIVTTGISPTLDILDFRGLLRKGLRIKILFLNPANKDLCEARYGLRTDKTPERCTRELQDQIGDIHAIARQYASGDRTKNEGSLEYGLSDAMPCGFVIHTTRWALLGIFLAHTSYSDGPMFEIRSETVAWKQLHDDWKARWEAARKPVTRKTSADRSVPSAPLSI